MLHIPTADWTEQSLDFLIRERVEEGETIDYKLQVPIDKPGEKAKAAKHVSAMTNTYGGRIIIGMDEHEEDGHNYPTAKKSLTDRAYVDRLLNVLRAHCQPLPGLSVKLIDLADGSGYCLVLDVTESVAPVMTVGVGENRYYHRVKWNSVAMNEREVRERYERMHARRSVIDQMIEEVQPMPRWELGAGQSPWLTILAVPAFGPVDLFNPSVFSVSDFLQYIPKSRFQLASHLPKPRPTYFGLESLDGMPEAPEYLLRLHRSGVIEYHHAVWDLHLHAHSTEGFTIVNEGPLRVSAGTEGPIMLDVLELAENLYRATGYVSALHIRGEYVGFGGWRPDSGSPQHNIVSPRPHQLDTSVDRLFQDRFDFVEGLLDRVWQSAGADQCDRRFDRSWSPGD